MHVDVLSLDGRFTHRERVVQDELTSVKISAEPLLNLWISIF